MLQRLHERIKGWIAGTIIGVISLSFVLWGVQYYLQSTRAGGGAVAKVDGKKITENELNSAYQRAQRQFTAHNGAPPTPTQNKKLKQLALQNLILNNVLLLSAENAGFRISQNQVNQFIMSIPSFAQDGIFSPQRYQQFLYSNALTPNQFAQRTNNLLLINQVEMGMQSSAFVLPQEARRGYGLLYQQRNFGYFVIPSARFVNSVKVTPQAIAKYYQQHQNTFKTPEKVSIAYIRLSPQAISKTFKISDTEIKQYYQDNLDNYRIPQRWKIQRIFLSIPIGSTPQQMAIAQRKGRLLVARLKKGVSFATLMKEQSGITQTVSQAEVSAQMSQVLSSLKAGHVSQPFRTPKGVNIVRLVATVPAKTRSFSAVQAQIKKMLVQQKTNAVLNKQSDQLANITYTNPTTLAPAAAALNVQVQTSEPFTRQGAKNGVASNSNVIATAFSDDVLQDGNNSNPIELKDGSIVVLRVKRHLPSRVPPLREVSARIKQRMTQQLAQAQAAIIAGKVQTALNQGKKSVSTVAREYHLTWHAKTAVTRKNKNIPSAIVSTAFAATLQKGQAVATAVLKNGDSAVVKVLAIKNANFEQASAQQQQQLVNDMAKYVGELEYQIYIKSAHKHTKIKIIT